MSAPSCGSSKSRERNGILTRLYGVMGAGSVRPSLQRGLGRQLAPGKRDEGREKAANLMPSCRQPMPAGLMTTSDPSFQFCAHDSPAPHRPRKRSTHDQSKVTLQDFFTSATTSSRCSWQQRAVSFCKSLAILQSTAGLEREEVHQRAIKVRISGSSLRWKRPAGRDAVAASTTWQGSGLLWPKSAVIAKSCSTKKVKGNKRDAVNGY